MRLARYSAQPGKYVLAVFLFVAPLWAAKEELPPLPEWTEDDLTKLQQGELLPGQALLTEKGLPKKEDKSQEKEDPKDKLPEKAEEKIEIKPVPEKPAIDPIPLSADRTEIPEKMLARYFGAKPVVGLNDPQQLLSMQERADIGYALDTHMHDSPVPIYLYLFDAQQTVPEEYEPGQVYEKFCADDETPSVIVYYFLGQPERSKFHLGGGASANVPEWRKRELLSNAAHTAREKSEIFSQLEDFVGQLSMRLFWVEQLMAKGIVPDDEEGAGEHAAVKKAKSLLPDLSALWNDVIAPRLLGLLGMVGGFVLLFGGFLFYRSRCRHDFAELPVKKRLSAKRGANCGGILNYKDANLPPSEQKEQFEETL